MKEPIHINIKALRKASNRTQEEIAVLLSTTRTNYSAWEEGRGKPSLAVIAKICELYNVTFMQLIGTEALKGRVTIKTTVEAKYLRAPENIRKAIDLLLN